MMNTFPTALNRGLCDPLTATDLMGHLDAVDGEMALEHSVSRANLAP